MEPAKVNETTDMACQSKHKHEIIDKPFGTIDEPCELIDNT